jgi:hypothetical protein
MRDVDARERRRNAGGELEHVDAALITFIGTSFPTCS